jgi:V/A-type H+-transporting ATPase subunit D
MSKDVKKTRSEELRLKERIELAESGHDILEKKRDGLIHEFMEIVGDAKDVNESLAEKYADAREAMDRSRVFDGEDRILAAASHAEDTPTVSGGAQNIMGVLVPQISMDGSVRKSLSERGYELSSTSAHIDSVADAHEELLEEIVRAAEVQTKVLKLLEEIEKTKRRVNALEHKTIPEMKESLDIVSQELMEQEREETFRMKKIKEMQDG